MGLTLRYLIHLSWFLYTVRVWGLVSIFFIFYMWTCSFHRIICWRVCLVFNISFGHLCQDSDGCGYVGLFWSSIYYSMVHVSFFPPISCCICYNVSGVYFEVRFHDAFKIALLVQDCLNIWGLFWFCIKFRIVFSSSVKNDLGIVTGLHLCR